MPLDVDNTTARRGHGERQAPGEEWAEGRVLGALGLGPWMPTHRTTVREAQNTAS